MCMEKRGVGELLCVGVAKLKGRRKNQNKALRLQSLVCRCQALSLRDVRSCLFALLPWTEIMPMIKLVDDKLSGFGSLPSENVQHP